MSPCAVQCDHLNNFSFASVFSFDLWHCFSSRSLSQWSFPQPRDILVKLEPGFGIKSSP